MPVTAFRARRIPPHRHNSTCVQAHSTYHGSTATVLVILLQLQDAMPLCHSRSVLTCSGECTRKR